VLSEKGSERLWKGHQLFFGQKRVWID